MKIDEEIKESIHKSVLCWLATANNKGIPNVSPKEIFTSYNDKIIVANIASPQTVRNIKVNENVCISFIDILVQKGFQLKGTARIVTSSDVEFTNMETILTKITKGKFPFSTITEITIKEVKKIIAPKYILYPETTEEEQIISAKKTYNL